MRKTDVQITEDAEGAIVQVVGTIDGHFFTADRYGFRNTDPVTERVARRTNRFGSDVRAFLEGAPRG